MGGWLPRPAPRPALAPPAQHTPGHPPGEAPRPLGRGGPLLVEPARHPPRDPPPFRQHRRLLAAELLVPLPRLPLPPQGRFPLPPQLARHQAVPRLEPVVL